MANGLIGWDNALEADDVTLSGAGWSDLPDAPYLPLGVRARSSTTSPDPIRVTWTGKKPVNLVFVGDTNLQQSATITVRRYSDAAWTTLIDETEQAFVPRLYSTVQLNWTADNFWAGVLPGQIYGAYQKNTFMLLSEALTGSMEIEFSDGTNPDGYLDFGWLMAGMGLRFAINYAIGQQDIMHRIEVPFDYLAPEDGDADVIWDMTLALQHHGPLAWLPDTDDLPLCWRYGGVMQLRGETGLDRAFWNRASRSALTMEGVTR